jgi:hypothetical protein
VAFEGPTFIPSFSCSAGLLLVSWQSCGGVACVWLSGSLGSYKGTFMERSLEREWDKDSCYEEKRLSDVR